MNREQELERALLICEGIALSAMDWPDSDPERYAYLAQKALEDVYSVAHGLSGRCCRSDGRAEEIVRELKEAGFVDVDKHMAKWHPELAGKEVADATV
jgi:hypothetical protein